MILIYMKTIFVFLVSLLFAYPLFAQSDKLLGRWVLDFALTEENSFVPLDNPYFFTEDTINTNFNTI